MKLYLVQHAEALPKEEDPARPLSEKGRADIRKVACCAVDRLGVRPARILHSGKRRALDTAEELMEALGAPKCVEATDGLSPLDDPSVWAARLSGEGEDLVLVGHLPHLARLTALLLCGDADAGVVRFQMGGIVCLEREERGDWGLRWAVVPEIAG